MSARNRTDSTTPPARSKWLGLLVDHDFRLLWTGETVSMFGTNITRLALPLVAVVTLDTSAFQVSLLTALTWLPWLIIGLPAGAWVDRLRRRPLMLGCDTASLLLLLSVPAAAWAGILTFTHVLLVALLVGTAAVFFETAYQVYLPSLVTTERLPEANAKLQGSEAAAQIAGPGVAGLITQLIGAVAGLLADAASFAVSALCLLRIRAHEDRPRSASGTDQSGLRHQIAVGLRFLGADRYLRVLAGFGALSNLALTGFQAVLVVFLVRDVGAPPGTAGILISGMSAGGLLGALLSTSVSRHLGSARGLLITSFAAGPFALLVPLAGPGPRLTLVVVGGAGAGAAIVIGNVLKTSFRQTYTPRPLLGRVVVGMQFLNYGTMPLGALLGGALTNPFGLRPTMWILAAGVALAPFMLLLGPLKRKRDFPTHPSTEPTQTP
jgi:MFS family permease